MDLKILSYLIAVANRKKLHLVIKAQQLLSAKWALADPREKLLKLN